MNRFQWRGEKDKGYELYVACGGVVVQLGEKALWDMTADCMIRWYEYRSSTQGK